MQSRRVEIREQSSADYGQDIQQLDCGVQTHSSSSTSGGLYMAGSWRSLSTRSRALSQSCWSALNISCGSVKAPKSEAGQVERKTERPHSVGCLTHASQLQLMGSYLQRTPTIVCTKDGSSSQR